jgi:hypothetical protein
MKIFSEVLDILNNWAKLGSKTTSNGTKLIGHVPHVGSMAYLHSIFGPLKEEEIVQVEQEINHNLSDDLKAFYRYANGCSLFLTLEITGLRKDYNRELNENVYQPISIRYQNVIDQPKNKTEEMVFFGGYDYDGSNLYMVDNDQRVFLCSSESAIPVLYEWESFETFLLSEVKRLSEIFDKKGYQIKDDIETIPPKGAH